jgi:hypothetical protein
MSPGALDARGLDAEWDAVCDALRAARRRVGAEGAPDSPRDRAEGFRHLTRFLAAGIAQCVAHADPDHPVFCRMIDHAMPWGLDSPDTLYLYAPVRGGARYRIQGFRGSAHHIDIQVNHGHFSQGEIASWGTIDSIDGFGLATDAEGGFELTLSEEPGAGNHLRLAPNAEFVLVRQYFADWERERPADLLIEREGAEWPIPPPRPEEMARRLARLRDWLEKGAALWDRMSRGLLAMPPNTLVVHHAAAAGERAGMRGQAYGMGNFRCAPDEAVIVELLPPRCHHWSLSLANFWWEAIEYASRQSSLNQRQARLDADGRLRAVIAHADPGVPNWLDPAGNPRGTLAARFLLADAAPTPALRVVPLARLRDELPPDTPRVDAAARAESLARRRRAVLRRFRC